MTCAKLLNESAPHALPFRTTIAVGLNPSEIDRLVHSIETGALAAVADGQNCGRSRDERA